MFIDFLFYIIVITSILASLKVSGFLNISWLVVSLPIVMPLSLFLIIVICLLFYLFAPSIVFRVKDKIKSRYFKNKGV